MKLSHASAGVALLASVGEAAFFLPVGLLQQRRGSSSLGGGEKFGSEECPCIGFDDIGGETLAVVKGKEVSYPADLGGSCEAWDESKNPECKGGSAPKWCSQKWCYVDPRNCHAPELPEMSEYQPKASYQNMPLHYSYSTCDAEVKPKETPVEGLHGCRCIGFDDASGSFMATIGKKKVEYPVETGSQCNAWDSERAPECMGGNDAPDWCKKKWCFVDPCSCSLEVPPKASDYLGEATFQGKQVYYSYATCGEEDSYSSKEKIKESTGAVDEMCSAIVSGPAFGEEDCPCIGFRGIEGDIMAKISGSEVTYPADLGSSCTMWDEGRHPECQLGDDEDSNTLPAWCKSEWCYVDPRKCTIPIIPKTAPVDTAYMPDARYQQLPLYYSYSTCGAEDKWAKQLVDIGNQGCRCIGFHGSPGSTKVNIGKKEIDFPSELGGECKAWDQGKHPDCEGKNPPEWCSQEWCFVDPCTCDEEVPPKISDYLGEATFQGRKVFYSYAACGAKDHYASEAKVTASKQHIAKMCPKKKEEAKNEDDDEVGDAPSDSDFNYNTSKYSKEWHEEWRHGDYPAWKGPDHDDYEVRE